MILIFVSKCFGETILYQTLPWKVPQASTDFRQISRLFEIRKKQQNNSGLKWKIERLRAHVGWKLRFEDGHPC